MFPVQNIIYLDCFSVWTDITCNFIFIKNTTVFYQIYGLIILKLYIYLLAFTISYPNVLTSFLIYLQILVKIIYI